METVGSIERLRSLPAEIRSLRQGFITNFYFDSDKHDVWIARGDCFAERIGTTVFIIKKSLAFWNVFYCSTTLSQFIIDLQLFIENHQEITLFFDVVGHDNQCKPIVEAFLECSCKEVISLVRMTRLTTKIDSPCDPTIRYATEESIPTICHLLHVFFDEQTEQIPYDEEIEEYARQNHILICVEQGVLAGFLIFEQSVSTLYLRYWFTHPDYRNRKVGSRLFRRFLAEGPDTKRQLLWVICSNENAMMRYRHYGFFEEDMYDYVMRYCKAY